MCEVYKLFVQHAKQRLSFLNNVITRSCQIFSMCWKSFKRLHRFSQAKDRQTADGKTMANALSKPRLRAVEKGWFLRSGRIYLKKRLYRPWFSCWTKQLWKFFLRGWQRGSKRDRFGRRGVIYSECLWTICVCKTWKLVARFAGFVHLIRWQNADTPVEPAQGRVLFVALSESTRVNV